MYIPASRYNRTSRLRNDAKAASRPRKFLTTLLRGLLIILATLLALTMLTIVVFLVWNAKPVPVNGYLAGVYRQGYSGGLPYRLRLPAHYDPHRRYPLLIFLHGSLEKGRDNTHQLRQVLTTFDTSNPIQQYPCFILAPQSPMVTDWMTTDAYAGTRVQHAQPSYPMQLLFGLVEALPRQYSIDRRRIYLTGISSGGSGVWDAISRRPELFAAVVPICGSGDATKANRMIHTPIWAIHGARDIFVRPSTTEVMVRAVRAAGGHPIFTEYPDQGHRVWNRAYRDPALFRWLFAQRLPHDPPRQ